MRGVVHAAIKRKMKYHYQWRCVISARNMRICYLQIFHQRFKKSIASVLCLTALLLMYAPMASATLMALSGTCCAGDYCPIHGNHRPAQSGNAEKNKSAPMDCGHEDHDTGKMDSCSMSCCHTVQQTAVNIHVFLLTPLAITTSLATLSPAPIALNSSIVSPVFAPQAPPPKHLST